ncbi:MAG: PQQ-binding-like beta-propeller repeat protein [Spirochaetales bacterium]
MSVVSDEWRTRSTSRVDNETYREACDAVSERFVAPVAAEVSGGVRSPYGDRINPFTGELELHFGVDIPAREGSSVDSVADGTVVLSNVHDRYSHRVIVEHTIADRTVYSLYSHLQSRLVEQGDSVKKGEAIGTLGETGEATNPHLHFEIFSPHEDGHPYLDALSEEGGTHNSPRGNVYYDPAVLSCSPRSFGTERPTEVWASATRAPVGSQAIRYLDSLIYSTGGGEIVSVRIADGMGRWRFESKGPLRASPALIEDTVVAANAQGSFFGLNAANGEKKWEIELDRPVSTDVLVGEDGLYLADETTVYAFEHGTGENKPERRWTSEREEDAFASVGTESVLYSDVLVTRDTYTITARSVSDGSIEWTRRMEAPVYGLAIDESSQTVLASGIDGSVAALDAESGEYRWRESLDSGVYSSPKVGSDGESVFLGARDGSMYALSLEDGSTRWSTPTGAVIDAAPIEFAGMLIVGNEAAEIVAFDTDDGAMLWRHRIRSASRLFATPTIVSSGDRVLLTIGVEGYRLGDGDGLRAFDLGRNRGWTVP